MQESEATDRFVPPLERAQAFCRVLKDADFAITHTRFVDACRAIGAIRWDREDDFRVALRTNLVSNREEEILFDRLFDRFWRERPDSDIPERGLSLRPEPVQGRLDEGWKETHRDLVADNDHFSPDEMMRDLNLTLRWDESGLPLEAIVKALAKKLATRESRRRVAAPRGERIDLRRTLRRSARAGAELAPLCRSDRRVRKTRLVLLCDVSGSMDAYNPFLLRLMLSLQKELPGSRTVVFSTQVTEITQLLRRRSVAETLREVSRSVRHWSGGTDIGHGLSILNRRILREGKARSTVTIVISDGYDQGDPDTIREELRALKRRVRSLVWINPMYGSMSYEPTATGMRAALPFVDHFLPAWDAASLRTLVRELGTV